MSDFIIKYQLIPVIAQRLWQEALVGIAHYPAHQWAYCAALDKSSPYLTFLFVGKNEEERVVCPLSMREKAPGYCDWVSPYGFSGFAGTSDQFAREAWTAFINDNEVFVTAYIMQHPSTRLSDDWEAVRGGPLLYQLDLQTELQELWDKMPKGYRYEIRRTGTGVALVVDQEELDQALLTLYPQTIERVDASNVYHFAPATLKEFSQIPGSMLLGARDKAGVQCLVLFLYTNWAADYFLNAATEKGRKYTRWLIWEGIVRLKELGVQTLNLGGGISPGDGLDDFKRRFGGTPVRSQVLKQIINPEKYAYLCDKYIREEARIGYFPPYWG